MKRGTLSPFLAPTCTSLSLLFSIVLYFLFLLILGGPNPVFRLSTYGESKVLTSLTVPIL